MIGLRYRAGVPLYDKTLQTVLGERPCRVIVVSDPTEQARSRPRPRRSSRSTRVIYRARGATASRWPSSLIGLVVLVVTLANGGGPASVGVLMGIAFVAVGVGRLWIAIEDGAVSEPGGAADGAATPERARTRCSSAASACPGCSPPPTRRSASRSTSRSASSPTAASA